MELKIGEPLNGNLKNTYAVHIDVYSGDADGYDSFRVLGFKPGEDEGLLKNLLKTVELAKKAYPRGRGGDDDLVSKVPGFNYWFGDESLEHVLDWDDYYYRGYEPETEKEKSYLRKWAPRVLEFRDRTAGLYERSNYLDITRGCWPLDSTLIDYSGSEASYERHRVTYFDGNGLEHAVEVTF